MVLQIQSGGLTTPLTALPLGSSRRSSEEGMAGSSNRCLAAAPRPPPPPPHFYHYHYHYPREPDLSEHPAVRFVALQMVESPSPVLILAAALLSADYC